jgi:hypothetical protein
VGLSDSDLLFCEGQEVIWVSKLCGTRYVFLIHSLGPQRTAVEANQRACMNCNFVDITKLL